MNTLRTAWESMTIAEKYQCIAEASPFMQFALEQILQEGRITQDTYGQTMFILGMATAALDPDHQ